MRPISWIARLTTYAKHIKILFWNENILELQTFLEQQTFFRWGPNWQELRQKSVDKAHFEIDEVHLRLSKINLMDCGIGIEQTAFP